MIALFVQTTENHRSSLSHIHINQYVSIQSLPLPVPFLVTMSRGGLALPDDQQASRVAIHALKLYDSNPSASGAQHAQSQRFLSHEWEGSDTDDPPLRKLVEAIAIGDALMSDYLTDQHPSMEIASFVRWVSAFRHAT